MRHHSEYIASLSSYSFDKLSDMIKLSTEKEITLKELSEIERFLSFFRYVDLMSFNCVDQFLVHLLDLYSNITILEIDGSSILLIIIDMLNGRRIKNEHKRVALLYLKQSIDDNLDLLKAEISALKVIQYSDLKNPVVINSLRKIENNFVVLTCFYQNDFFIKYLDKSEKSALMKFVYDSSLILIELTNKFNDEYYDYTLRSNTFVDDYINLRTKMKEDNFEKPKEYVRGIRLGLLFHLVKVFQYDSFIFNSLCQYTETFFDVLSRAFNDNSQNKGEKGMMLFLNKCKKGPTSKRNSCKNLFIYLLVFKFSFKFFGEKNAKPFIILINKNKSLIYETSETKDIILNILYSCNFRSEVIYESQDLLVDFLENMPIENLTEGKNILKAVTYLFYKVGRISLKNVKSLTKLIIDNK